MALSDFISPDTPLSEQKVWEDVEPAASRGDDVLVAIQLDESEREVIQYFLAVSAAGEKTRRALALTEAVSCVPGLSLCLLSCEMPVYFRSTSR